MAIYSIKVNESQCLDFSGYWFLGSRVVFFLGGWDRVGVGVQINMPERRSLTADLWFNCWKVLRVPLIMTIMGQVKAVSSLPELCSRQTYHGWSHLDMLCKTPSVFNTKPEICCADLHIIYRAERLIDGQPPLIRTISLSTVVQKCECFGRCVCGPLIVLFLEHEWLAHLRWYIVLIHPILSVLLLVFQGVLLKQDHTKCMEHHLDF